MPKVKITIETQTEDFLKAEKLKSALSYMIKEIGEDGLVKLKEKYESSVALRIAVAAAIK